MASFWVRMVVMVLLLLIIDVDSRSHSRHRSSQDTPRSRRLFGKLRDKFHFDSRHFDKEGMLLFPDVAFQSLGVDDNWKVMVHGWRYEGNKRHEWFGISISKWFDRIARHMISKDDLVYLNGSINQDRLKPFFVEDEVNDVIQIQIADKTHSVRTDKSGQFYEQFIVSNDEMKKMKEKQPSPGVVSYETIGDSEDKLTGTIRLIEPRQGLSVISDIDDTIKISEVLDKVRLLANTFIHPFKPVPGMADVYQQWLSKYNDCTFHYLSGMPDQLYTLTQEFIDTNKFPDGSFHMRHFGWAMQSLFNFLHSDATFIHKMSYLRFFFSNTQRDYVLVGDSGEKDPEIYGTIAREYPDRVRAIFIRAIKGEAFDDQRFVNAFQGTPNEKWLVFNDPKQLPIDLSRPPRAAVAAAG